jgi:hypothetical protein
MRGIGIGQKIEICLIPELVHRIEEELGPIVGDPQNPNTDPKSPTRTGDFLLDVPTWLLLNSMRMESLQFVQLSLQEVHNVWRKRALDSLVGEVCGKSKVYHEGLVGDHGNNKDHGNSNSGGKGRRGGNANGGNRSFLILLNDMGYIIYGFEIHV